MILNKTHLEVVYHQLTSNFHTQSSVKCLCSSISKGYTIQEAQLSWRDGVPYYCQLQLCQLLHSSTKKNCI